MYEALANLHTINQNKPYGDFPTAADSNCEFNVFKPYTSKPCKCIDVPVMFDLNYSSALNAAATPCLKVYNLNTINNTVAKDSLASWRPTPTKEFQVSFSFWQAVLWRVWRFSRHGNYWLHNGFLEQYPTYESSLQRIQCQNVKERKGKVEQVERVKSLHSKKIHWLRHNMFTQDTKWIQMLQAIRTRLKSGFSCFLWFDSKNLKDICQNKHRALG